MCENREPARTKAMHVLTRDSGQNSNSADRPTAQKLLAEHPFCAYRDDYNFHDTELYKKIKGTWKTTN